MSFDPTDKSNYCIGEHKNDEIEKWMQEAMQGNSAQGKDAWCEEYDRLLENFLEFMGAKEIEYINLADYEERAHKFFQ